MTMTGQKRRVRGYGFTLVELLVAIAITSVLFTLLFIPMTQALDQARRGRIMAGLQASADFVIDGLVRELHQAMYIFPQQRLDDNDDFDGDGIVNEPLDLYDGERNDDDSLGRIDFVLPDRLQEILRSPLVPVPTVITYYGRVQRPAPGAPNQGFKYLPGSDDPDGDGRVGEDPIDGVDNDGDGLIDEDDIEPNPRCLYRAVWVPDPNRDNLRFSPTLNRWLATGGWIRSDLQPFALSHSSLTPLDGTDLADLRCVLGQDSGEPVRSVTVQLTLRKPTPGARARNPRQPDVPSIMIQRRIQVVLSNVR